MFLRGIEQVRSVEWSRSYLWDLNFPDLGLDWFPAVDVEETLGTINSHEFAQYLRTYKIPLGSAAFDLKITWIERADHRISNWITDWMNKRILNDGSHVATVEEASRIVHVAKLNPDRSVLKQTSYMVYPEGSLYFHGSSDSTAEMITQQFVVTGI